MKKGVNSHYISISVIIMFYRSKTLSLFPGLTKCCITLAKEDLFQAWSLPLRHNCQTKKVRERAAADRELINPAERDQGSTWLRFDFSSPNVSKTEGSSLRNTKKKARRKASIGLDRKKAIAILAFPHI